MENMDFGYSQFHPKLLRTSHRAYDQMHLGRYNREESRSTAKESKNLVENHKIAAEKTKSRSYFAEHIFKIKFTCFEVLGVVHCDSFRAVPDDIAETESELHFFSNKHIVLFPGKNISENSSVSDLYTEIVLDL